MEWYETGCTTQLRGSVGLDDVPFQTCGNSSALAALDHEVDNEARGSDLRQLADEDANAVEITDYFSWRGFGFDEGLTLRG